MRETDRKENKRPMLSNLTDSAVDKDWQRTLLMYHVDTLHSPPQLLLLLLYQALLEVTHTRPLWHKWTFLKKLNIVFVAGSNRQPLVRRQTRKDY